jgi:hypothetical protein
MNFPRDLEIDRKSTIALFRTFFRRCFGLFFMILVFFLGIVSQRTRGKECSYHCQVRASGQVEKIHFKKNPSG